MNYQETITWMFNQSQCTSFKEPRPIRKIWLTPTSYPITLKSWKKKLVYSRCWNKRKGSTSHMLASILHEAGYKVGLYTSPKDFRTHQNLMPRLRFPTERFFWIQWHDRQLDSWKRKVTTFCFVGGRLDATKFTINRWLPNILDHPVLDAIA
jgi:hypothetical protein